MSAFTLDDCLSAWISRDTNTPTPKLEAEEIETAIQDIKYHGKNIYALFPREEDDTVNARFRKAFTYLVYEGSEITQNLLSFAPNLVNDNLHFALLLKACSTTITREMYDFAIINLHDFLVNKFNPKSTSSQSSQSSLSSSQSSLSSSQSSVQSSSQDTALSQETLPPPVDPQTEATREHLKERLESLKHKYKQTKPKTKPEPAYQSDIYPSIYHLCNDIITLNVFILYVCFHIKYIIFALYVLNRNHVLH